MAATTFATIISDVRRTNLIESSASYWTDAELGAILNNGAIDLWRRIVDLYEHHFVTVDETNVSLAASTATLSGVPADCYRVVSIEPRTLGESNPNTGLIFQPRDWNHPDFKQARGASPITPSNNSIYYCLFGVGGPISAPVIRISPRITSAALLTLVYNYTLPLLTEASSNPIPGGSDNALKAWLTAYAKSKERDDGAPDPEWLAIYGTEKTNLIIGLAPRQIQESKVAEAFLADLWQD
jgi:hypothetical protein